MAYLFQGTVNGMRVCGTATFTFTRVQQLYTCTPNKTKETQTRDSLIITSACHLWHESRPERFGEFL